MPDLIEPVPAGALPRFRGLALRSFLFGAGSIAQKVVGVLLVPIIARALTTAEFGRLEILSTVITTVTSITVLGMDVVVTRRWVDLDEAGRSRMFSSWVALATLLGGSAAATAAILAPSLSRLVFDTADLAPAVRVVGLCALVNLLSVVGLTALRNQDRSRAYAAITVTAVVVNAILSGVLVWWLRTVEAVLIGLTLATSLGAAMALFAARRLLVRRPSPKTAGTLLLASSPLVPGLLFASGGDLASRFVLLERAGATEVGFYSVAIRFVGVGLLVHTGFQLAWQPRAYGIAHQPGGRRRLGDDAALISVILALVTVALGCLSPELLRLLAGSRYEAALPAVGIGLLVPLATLLLTISSTPLAIANRLRALGATTAAAALTSVALTMLLAGPHGAAGAMAALAGGQLLGAALAFRLARGSPTTAEFGRWTWAVLMVVSAAVTLAATLPPGGLAMAPRGLALAGFVGLVGWRQPGFLGAGLAVLRPPQRR